MTRPRTCTLLLLLLVAPAAAADFTLIDPDTGAFVDPSSAPPFLHWDLREFPGCEIPYAVNAAGSADMGFAAAVAEIDAAFQVWEDVDPAILGFTNVGATAAAGLVADNENVISWDNDLCSGDPWDPALQGGAVALVMAWISDVDAGIIGEMDIVFDDEHFVWNAGVQSFDSSGDDLVVGLNVQEPVFLGNLVCDSSAVCDDVQLIPLGVPALAGAICIGPGANGVLESLPNFGGLLDVWATAAGPIGAFCGIGRNDGVGNGGEGVETLLDENYIFAPGDTLTVTVNGTVTTMALPPGAYTAAAVAALLNPQLPGTAVATATPCGSVRIDATNPVWDVVINGGNAATVLGFPTIETGISTMRNPLGEVRAQTTLDQRTLARDDIDALNFLYSPDLGDAADPFLGLGFNQYPSLVHSTKPTRMLNGVQLFLPGRGAVHLFGSSGSCPRYQYEWLAVAGGSIDGSSLECEARVANLDSFDDGVRFRGVFVPGGVAVPVEFHVQTARDVVGNEHDYMDEPMYLNAWFDWNADGDWDDAGEQVLGAGAGLHPIVSPSSPSQIVVTAMVSAPLNAIPGGYARVRLDWGEDVDEIAGVDPSLQLSRGVAQLGEVEDYTLCISRLDATPNPVAAGANLSLTTSGGQPHGLYFLWVVDVNGVPTFLRVLTGQFDAGGRATVSGKVPASLSGATMSFQSFGSGWEGRLAATNAVLVRFL